MPPSPRVARYRGRFYVEFYEGSKRRRSALGTPDRALAETRFATWLIEVNRPDRGTVKALWDAYVSEKQGKPVIATMQHTWKALAPTFANVRPEDVSVDLSRSHTARRRQAGISDGTIWTELGHLRTVLLWAHKRGSIDRAPFVERPNKPKPKERHLSREEARRLVAGASMPHAKLFIHLALATAARRAALLDLTWDRVNFESGMIDLRNPSLRERHKGRALVPMNRTARAALVEAKEGARSPFVIEWAGRRVSSVRRSLTAASRRAGIEEVTPHVLRHTAAVWMAEAGVPMSEISQYLGHGATAVTERVYARYSPDYLRGAASALEFDDISEERKAR
jgi:integrase